MRDGLAKFEPCNRGSPDSGKLRKFFLRQKLGTAQRPDATRQVLPWINSRTDSKMIQS